jgi:hypothetical protein
MRLILTFTAGLLTGAMLTFWFWGRKLKGWYQQAEDWRRRTDAAMGRHVELQTELRKENAELRKRLGMAKRIEPYR